MSEMQACCPACGFDVAAPVTRFTSAPSPFFILITTNGIVPPSDDDLLSHYLQGVRADISAQDDVIRRIKSALTTAETEKNRLQGVFDSHAVLRPPIRTCPPEVLTEIFHWTITTPLDDNHLGLRELNARLSKISAVCCLWRTTVLSSPSLWARFRLVGSGNEGLMPLLQTVLDRSREASLCIDFQSMFAVDIEEDTFLRCALGTSPRWKRASIKLVDDDIDIYAQIRGRLPRLEWLELVHYFDDESPSGPRFDAFEDAPQSRALALDGSIPVQTLALPWTQIISLDINYVIDRDNRSAVLSMTPNLQVLTLDYDEVNHRTDGWKSKKSEDIVTCPSLRRVHVTDLALFRSFNFPSLEELSLKVLGIASHWLGKKDDKKTEDIFHDFLERSGSPIKKLKLEDITDVPDFSRTFHMAFRLVDLDVTLPDPATAALFFRALLSTGDKTDVLPELRSLKAECRTIANVKDLVEVDDIADMIVSRYHPPNAAVAEIQSVHITLPYLSLLRRQSFQARLKNLPDLLNFISIRDEIYILFVWSDERLIGLLAWHIFDMPAMLFTREFIQSVANSLEESDPSFDPTGASILNETLDIGLIIGG